MAFDVRKKEMIAQFNDNIVGIASPQIVWDGVANKSIDKDLPWIAVNIDPTITGFAGINKAQSNNGTKRKVRHTGLFEVQIFTKPGTTTEQADLLVNAVGDALEGSTTPGGVLFRETEIVRVGVVGGYYQLNTFTRYQYDDLR